MSIDPGQSSVEVVVEDLAKQVQIRSLEIYNEFSLQHELGILLRDAFPNLRVQFERNVAHFGLDKENFTKREIDITGFSANRTKPHFAIELKFPRRGQYPEQMFSFCKDILFLEQLKRAGFERCFFLAVVDDKLFYEGSKSGIYGYFRGGKTLTGEITKPTGRKDRAFSIQGPYDIAWRSINDPIRYTLVKIGGYTDCCALPETRVD